MDLNQIKQTIDMLGEFVNLFFNVRTARRVEDIAGGAGGGRGAAGGPRVPTAEERAERRKKLFTEALLKAKTGKDVGDKDSVDEIEKFLGKHQSFISDFTPEEAEYGLAYVVSDKDVDVDELAEKLKAMNKMAEADPNFLPCLTRIANDRATINMIFSTFAKGWHHLTANPRLMAKAQQVATRLQQVDRDMDRELAPIVTGIRQARQRRARHRRTWWESLKALLGV